MPDLFFTIGAFFLGALISALAYRQANNQRDLTKATTLERLKRIESEVSLDKSGVILPGSPDKNSIPDYAASIFQLTSPSEPTHPMQIVAVASKRGTGHVRSGESRQDSFTVFADDDHSVLVISDGVSSATQSQLGSAFIVSNFQRMFEEIFEGSDFDDLDKWGALNKRISKGLVSMHIARLKKQGGSDVDTTSALRSGAAEQYAATLEVLIVEKPGVASPHFYYVRLAGDGNLSLLSKGGAVSLAGANGNLAEKRATVNALPVYDGAPMMHQGQIEQGESLILSTDGVGDYLFNNPEWLVALQEFCRAVSEPEVDLLKLVSFNDPNARDDRTIAIVRCF